MRALKLLVVVMGVLLVLGTGALVWAVIYRVNHRPAAPAVSAAAGTGRHTVVDLPAGARLEASDVAGERLVLRLALPEGGRRFLLFDLRNGARVGTIDLHPGSSSGESKP